MYALLSGAILDRPEDPKKTPTTEANMKKTGSKIPAGFWATPEGCTLNVVMHISAWDGLDCLNDQIEALAKAGEATADAAIKAEIEKAKAKVIAARAACRKAMAILSDSTF